MIFNPSTKGKEQPVIQADWNQNDIAANDYIKNRPFYAENAIDTTIIDNYTVDQFQDTGIWYFAQLPAELFNFNITNNNKYLINWDNVEYELTGYTVYDNEQNKDSGFFFIGNINYTMLGWGTGGEVPFAIIRYFDINDDYSNYVHIVTESKLASHTITIRERHQKINSIDSNFLPEGYPYRTYTNDCLIIESTLDFGAGSSYGLSFQPKIISPHGSLINNCTYTVIWDNVEYSNLIAFSDDISDNICLGAKSVFELSEEMPFSIYCNKTINNEMPVIVFTFNAYDAENDHTVSITGPCVNIKAIDMDYLPAQIHNLIGSHGEGEGSECFNGIHPSYVHGPYSHAEGNNSKTYGDSSHAEGGYTAAYGTNSHAEGCGPTGFSYLQLTGEANATTYTITKKSSDVYAIMPGQMLSQSYYLNNPSIITNYNPSNNSITVNKTLNADSAISQKTYDLFTGASGKASHSEGEQTTAYGQSAHAEGYYTGASGNYSHAEGQMAITFGKASHAEGTQTIANGENSHVQGKFNIEDTENKLAHIVGNGSNTTRRSNAHTLDWDGNAWFSGDVYVSSTSGTNKDAGSVKLSKEGHTHDDLKALITAIPKFNIKVVNTLPTEGASNTTVYLVPSVEEETNNIYTEYIFYVEDPNNAPKYDDELFDITAGTWEKLGAQKIDLSNYATKPSLIKATLTTNNWNSSTLTQTITVNGIVADEMAQIIHITPIYNSANIEEIGNCGIYASAQGTNSITFSCETVPTSNVEYYIEWYSANPITA